MMLPFIQHDDRQRDLCGPVNKFHKCNTVRDLHVSPETVIKTDKCK